MARLLKFHHRPLWHMPPGTTTLMVVFLVAGIVVGALLVRVVDAHQKQELIGHLEGFVQGLRQQSPLPDSGMVWQISAWQHLRMAGMLWFLGLTVIGLPLICALVFVRGLLMGFTVGFFVQELGYHGVVLSVAGVLPHHLLGIPVFMFLATYVGHFSFTLHQQRSLRRELAVRIALYTLVCIGLTLLLLGASLIEAHVSPWLMLLALRWLS